MSDARKAILARRAKFLAAALVATLPACDREKEGIQPDHAQPQKSQAADANADKPATSPSPADAAMAMPCLEVMPDPTATPDAGPKPHPCLKIPPPHDAGPKPSPTPQPCLKMSVGDD
jgi:hypothetical protein